MKKRIYTLESLRLLLEEAKNRKFMGSLMCGYDGADLFIKLLEFAEKNDKESFEVVIVKRKNGRFVKQNSLPKN
jgi:hypothetical protein